MAQSEYEENWRQVLRQKHNQVLELGKEDPCACGRKKANH